MEASIRSTSSGIDIPVMELSLKEPILRRIIKSMKNKVHTVYFIILNCLMVFS